MKSFQRWTRYAVVRQIEMKTQRRIPGHGGFRLMSDALLFIEDHKETPEWKWDYAPPSIDSIVRTAYLPAFSYCPGRALSDIQQEHDYVLMWRHRAASVSRPGVSSTDKDRLEALASALNLLFADQQHRVIAIADGYEVPWSSWDAPVDGAHPLWKLPRVPRGIQTLLGGRWRSASEMPVPESDRPGDGLGERSMVL